MVRLAFGDMVMFKCWVPGESMPEDLVQGIVNTLDGCAPPPPAPCGPLPPPKPSPVLPPTHDVFISLRWGESKREAMELQRLLQSRGLRVFGPLDEHLPGDNIVDKTVAAFEGSRLVIMMASRTYGREGSTWYTTFAEMTYTIALRKPFFLIRMIPWETEFEEASTQLTLTNDIMAVVWLPGTPMPAQLVEQVLEKLDRPGEGRTESEVGGPSSVDSGISLPTSSVLRLSVGTFMLVAVGFALGRRLMSK